MYCPRCSQQQGDEVSFCSRCGFQLGVVKELLVTDGALPASATDFQPGFLSPNRQAARRGAKLIFFSLISLPLFFALSFTFDSPVPFWPPALIFLAGLTLLLYTSIFGEDIVPSKKEARSALFGRVVSSPKVPLQSVASMAELGTARVNTAEMTQPPSISERTTNLL